MQYENAIRRLERTGFTVERDFRSSVMRPGATYEAGFTARKPGAACRIEVTRNGDEDLVATICVVRDNDHDDLMTDYFAGTYCGTLKQAIDFAGREPATPAQRVRQEVKELFR